jgi:hypothetical protein
MFKSTFERKARLLKFSREMCVHHCVEESLKIMTRGVVKSMEGSVDRVATKCPIVNDTYFYKLS